MSIISKLSSQIGEKTEEGNRNVAKQCIVQSSLLEEIKEGLRSKDAALIGDCAEVFTKVAEEKTELIAPYINDLVPLLAHKTTRVRWEAMHAIALITTYIPNEFFGLIPQIKNLIDSDKSTIVRDYAIDSMCNYANLGEYQADTAYPILKEALQIWEGKHRGRVLKGLLNVSNQAPKYTLEIRGIAEEYMEDNKGVVKKAAKALIKEIDKVKK